MPSLEHVIRLGTLGEREYLAKGRIWFDRLLVNANLVQANRDALSLFVLSLQRPFAIDPITYAFARNPRLLTSASGKVKRTFQELANAYEMPDASQLGRHPFEPDQLAESKERFARAVAAYQDHVFEDVIRSNADFLVDQGASQLDAVHPSEVLAPYFINDFRGPWLELNLELAEATYAIVGNVSSVLAAFDSRAASRAHVEVLSESYEGVAASRLYVWATDLDEHSSPEDSLQTYAEFVARLSVAGKRVIAAYGGYFAMLLGYRGLAGVSHSIGYGDKRDAEPVVGGGLPPARYYVPALRDFIPLGDLVLVVEGMDDSDFLEQVCDCTICRTLVVRGGVTGFVLAMTETERRPHPTRGYTEVPTPRVSRMVRYHFLESRAKEFRELAAEQDYQVTAERVRRAARWAGEWFGDYAIAHIERWLAVARPTQ